MPPRPYIWLSHASGPRTGQQVICHPALISGYLTLEGEGFFGSKFGVRTGLAAVFSLRSVQTSTFCSIVGSGFRSMDKLFFPGNSLCCDRGMPKALGKMFMISSRKFGFHISQRRRLPAGCFAKLRFSPESSDGDSLYTLQETGGTRSSFIWPSKRRPRVCILGGGFGGLYTALRLESLVWTDDKRPQVLLIDKAENFVFKPMLYELLSGEVEPWEIAPSFSDLLANTGVEFVKDRVKLIEHSDNFGSHGSGTLPYGGTVHLESGCVIEYDWLVLSLGAESKLDLVPGASEFALPFSSLDDALRVNETLCKLERTKFGKDSPIRVAIVGCGYSGVELAATLSERLSDKGNIQAISVGTTICPDAPSGNREAALKVLSSRNIQLLLGYYVKCVRESFGSDVLNGSPVLADAPTDIAESQQRFLLDLQPAQRGLESKIVEADIVLWTVGSKPSIPQAETFGRGCYIPLNSRGQAEIDETLQVKGHPRIFAIGDSAALRDSSGSLLPATAQVAFQQADFAGWNLWAAINERPLLPFRFQNLGEMMTLGTSDAAISPSFIEGLTLDGPIGHTARKLAYLLRLPTDEHRIKVGISWLTKSAVDSFVSLQDSLSEIF